MNQFDNLYDLLLEKLKKKYCFTCAFGHSLSSDVYCQMKNNTSYQRTFSKQLVLVNIIVNMWLTFDEAR